VDTTAWRSVLPPARRKPIPNPKNERSRIVAGAIVAGTQHCLLCSPIMDTSTENTDPAFWRERAEEARRMAEQLSDAVAQQTLRDIAEGYEQLAKLAEARQATGKTT
jgi:hypothetical protein